MKLIIGEKKVNIPDIEFMDRYVKEGSEGTIYEYKGDALKIYHERCFKKRLTEEEAKKLSNIKTKRIMMPKDLIYDENGEFIGYTTPFKIEREKKYVGLLKMEELLKEANIINNDAMILAKQKISLKDLHYDNLLLSNNEIYLCDPGEYEFCDNSVSNIYRDNIIELNYLFTRMILTDYLGLTNAQKEALKNYFEPSDDYFIDRLTSEKEYNFSQKVKPFFDKLTKKLIL